ncbi:hypothetical protein SNEBB_003585 [Seison nebaliae]|nr:hypothetical protein SNEBB_003585 [Seison nebaliae]
MARIEDYRIAIIANQCAPRFLELLCENVGFQIHYQICFVFWQLTYEKDFAEQISKPKYLAAFTELIGDSAREKVVRIVCALLRNLLDVVEDKEMRKNNAVTMVHLKVLRRLSIYTEGKEIKDIELKDDLEYICKELEVRIDGISSFDEYQAEIKTRQLEWSPVHKSEKFWAENAHNLNANNYELIRILIQCLKENKDPLSICVAAHDLGQYVRYYGRGKHVLEQLGGKQIIMALLTHPDTNVRYQALLAVQKIMVHNWEYVSKSSKTDNDAPHSSSKQIATN